MPSMRIFSMVFGKKKNQAPKYHEFHGYDNLRQPAYPLSASTNHTHQHQHQLSHQQLQHPHQQQPHQHQQQRSVLPLSFSPWQYQQQPSQLQPQQVIQQPHQQVIMGAQCQCQQCSYAPQQLQQQQQQQLLQQQPASALVNPQQVTSQVQLQLVSPQQHQGPVQVAAIQTQPPQQAFHYSTSPQPQHFVSQPAQATTVTQCTCQHCPYQQQQQQQQYQHQLSQQLQQQLLHQHQHLHQQQQSVPPTSFSPRQYQQLQQPTIIQQSTMQPTSIQQPHQQVMAAQCQCHCSYVVQQQQHQQQQPTQVVLSEESQSDSSQAFSRYANVQSLRDDSLHTQTHSQSKYQEHVYCNQKAPEFTLPPYKPPPDYSTFMERKKTIDFNGRHTTYHSESHVWQKTKDSSYENLRRPTYDNLGTGRQEPCGTS